MMSCYVADPNLFVTNFGEYSTGAQPADWSAKWVTTGYTALVQSVAGSLSGKALRWTKTAASRQGLSWDRVPLAANVEILMRARAIESWVDNDVFMRCMIRGSGAAGAETGYSGANAGLNTSTLIYHSKLKQLSGTQTTISGSPYFPTPGPNYTVNTWYWFRFRVQGTSISTAMWLNGQAETPPPETITDSGITAAGWTGLWQNDVNPNMEIDFFGVAIGGGVVPLPV